MRKTIVWALLIAMCLSLFAGCGNNAENTPTPTQGSSAEENLADALAYVKAIYKNAETETGMDYQRLANVRVGDAAYTVTWTADVAEDVVKIVPGGDMVSIDINETVTEDTPYVLTATITGADGASGTLTWNHVIPAALGTDFGAILDAAYALESGASLPAEATLTGMITAINTAWSEDYQNITVTIVMEGYEDKPIMCYRLKGEGAADLAPGDTITVTGIIKNYNGTIEFDAGCVLDEVVKGDGTVPGAQTDTAEIMAAAYALEPGQSLTSTATLTGTITAINTPWSEDYQNITVTIVVEGYEDKPIMCYRLKGEGAKDLAVGDAITVTGIIKNYNGTVEFDAGCALDAVTQGNGTIPGAPTDPAEIMAAAYALERGQSLPYSATLTGQIYSIETKYSNRYKNISVAIRVEGSDKTIVCFRLKGEGTEKLGLNDVITVTGVIKNYNGTIEFDAGCTLDSWIDNEGYKAPNDPLKIVDEAFAMWPGRSMNYYCTLTGTVTAVNTPWSDKYQNITVTFVVPGREDFPIQCYRLEGEGAQDIGVGDTITVYGVMKNVDGVIRFKQGCQLSALVKGEAPVAPTDPVEIVNAAYALEEGESLPYDVTLTGAIVTIDTPYSEKYGNITVTIAVPGAEDKPIMCFRLKGDGAADLAVGDTITVSGSIKNYNGTIEFVSGCTLDAVVKGEETAPVAPTDPVEIVNAAYALEEGESLPYNVTLTGAIVTIDTPYSEQYGNITVTIAVPGAEDKPIMCFRLKGDGAADLAVGDTITVSGSIKNYNGTIEFVSGCTLG